MNMEGKMQLIYFMDEICPKQAPGFKPVNVDQWLPVPEQVIINCQPGFFIAPLSVFYNLRSGDNMDYFVLSTKKGYHSPAMRSHLFRYINYFINYYDQDFEYMGILYVIKTKIDRYATNVYPVEAFIYDMERYILNSSIVKKVSRMVEDNYTQNLNYSNFKIPSLRYTNENAKTLHLMSILMNLCMPLLTHYAYMHKVQSTDELLKLMYDKILYIDSGINMYDKLYETASTNIITNQRNNPIIWDKQNIRGIDTTTHSVDSVDNIILNIMPKYTFEKNVINFNFSSIRRNTQFKVTDIAYEYSYKKLSSSIRDNDSTSEFDKFEDTFTKANEAQYIQNEVNCDWCMNVIEDQFGPFSEEEISHYMRYALTDAEGNPIINPFQKRLVFLLFYRWFRDTQSINAINRIQYTKLIISARRLLLSKGMKILPYIISGRIDKLVSRKTINKKEGFAVESSPSYPLILEKYKDQNVVDDILSIIATIISSDFSLIDMDPKLNGLRFPVIAVNDLIEELETYMLMC